MGDSHEDREWVVKGPHASMVIKHPIELLEKEILSLLRVHRGMRLSQIWLRCSCHLWEVSLALERLKEKGLVEESRPYTLNDLKIQIMSIPNPSDLSAGGRDATMDFSTLSGLRNSSVMGTSVSEGYICFAGVGPKI